MAAAALVVAIASIGGPANPVQSAAAVLWWLVLGGFAPALYIASGIGLGRIALPLFRGAKERWAIQAAVGLSKQLTLGHAINCVGDWLPGVWWNVAALAPGVLGLVLLGLQLHKEANERREEGADGARAGQIFRLFAFLVCGLGLSVMLVAACAPPRWLWASEFGGFDALSYHLQLPREWLEMGRLWPLTHNVYSYLPSYFESAFLTLQLWTFAPRSTADGMSGMLAGDGWRMISTQMLHAGFGIVAAWMIAAGTRELGRRVSQSEGFEGGAWIAAAAFLCVPWVIVTGSMAYDELVLCACFGGAMLIALSVGGDGAGGAGGAGGAIKPFRGAILCGWLVGVACDVKPTALFFVSPVIGLTLLWGSPKREWMRLVLGAATGGLVALAPWLLRNYIAGGNPVFPYAHAIFGDGHWTAEQHARFAGAHHFVGTWGERLKLLFVADENDPAGARHRGLTHWQWSIFFPTVAIAGLIGLIARRTRSAAGLLAIGLLIQLTAWLALTHLQSRFLLPLVVPGAMLIGLIGSGGWRTSGAAGNGGRGARFVRAAALLAIAFMGMRGLDNFWSQRRGQPNALLAIGPTVFENHDLRDPKQGLSKKDLLYLLGNSTPLYLPGPLIYHTTWDASPLGDAIRATPGEAKDKANAWSAELRDRGIDAVLITPSEIDRLAETKWYDPAVTLEIVKNWVEFGAKPVRMFQDSGELLVRPVPATSEKNEKNAK